MNDLEELIRLRRTLHQIPEVGFEEYKTQAFVVNELKKTSAKLTFDFYHTAVIAVFNWHDGAPMIAFRADMDALSVTEAHDYHHASKHVGKMHACGHDGHMAMLLMLAKQLDQTPPQGVNVTLIFQPAEEGPGGAKGLIETETLKKLNLQAIFGIHLFPGLDFGVIGTRPGPMMAQTGEVDVTFEGISCHGAQPHLGKDALLAAAEFVLSSQSIVSRSINPLEPCVLTFGQLTAGERVNVIAGHASLKGTIRAFSEATYQSIKDRILTIARGVASVHQLEVNITYRDMYPAVDNDKDLARFVLGLDPTEEIAPVMLAEDFSYYSQLAPSCFVFLGTKQDHMGDEPLHAPTFDFDEAVLLRGLAFYRDVIRHFGQTSVT